MAKIVLSKGQIALVDDQDFRLLNKHNWYLSSRGYAMSGNSYKGNKPFLMHRLLMEPAKGQEVDHINGNKIDNRRSNLRLCTHQQNMQNQAVQKRNLLGIKGVRKHRSKWQAQIVVERKAIYLGTFNTIKLAAEAYNHAAIAYFGQFARLNS